MPTLARLAALTLCLAPAPLLLAQPDQPPGGAPSPRFAEVNPPITLDFPGGTLGQFVEAIRKAAAATVPDAAVNVVFTDPALAGFPVPRVQLRHVSVEAALGAATYRDRTGSAGPVLDRVGTRTPSANAPVYVITSAPESRQRAARVEIFDIRDLARSRPQLDGILTAIDTALRMEGAGPPPEVKFHEDSGLLITRATPEQLDSVRQVIGRLLSGSHNAARERQDIQRRESVMRLRAETDDLHAQSRAMRGEVLKVRQEMMNAENLARAAGTPEERAPHDKRRHETHLRLTELEMQADRIDRELRSREAILQQVQAAEYGAVDHNAEIARLRAENADLRARLDALEKKAR